MNIEEKLKDISEEKLIEYYNQTAEVLSHLTGKLEEIKCERNEEPMRTEIVHYTKTIHLDKDSRSLKENVGELYNIFSYEAGRLLKVYNEL